MSVCEKSNRDPEWKRNGHHLQFLQVVVESPHRRQPAHKAQMFYAKPQSQRISSTRLAMALDRVRAFSPATPPTTAKSVPSREVDQQLFELGKVLRRRFGHRRILLSLRSGGAAEVSSFTPGTYGAGGLGQFTLPDTQFALRAGHGSISGHLNVSECVPSNRRTDVMRKLTFAQCVAMTSLWRERGSFSPEIPCWKGVARRRQLTRAAAFGR